MSCDLYSSPVFRSTVLLLILGLLLAACSSPTSGSTSPTTTVVDTTVASSPTPSSSTTITTGAIVEDTTTTTVIEYDVILEGGNEEIPEITVLGPDVFAHSVGDEVEITVLSSVDDEMHVHGYDLHFEVMASEVTVITFTADVFGIFDVELENSHFRLFSIEVTP